MIKKEISNEEMMFYLEEMIQMELATETEEKVYEDIRWHGRCKRSELNQVKDRMRKWYEEQF